MENSVQVYNEFKTLAVELTKSEMCPAHFKKAQDAWWAILKGRELGLSPIYSLDNISVIKGRTSLSADAMLAICRTNPEYGGVEITDEPNVCTVTLRRVLRSGVIETRTVRFSFEDAKAAGLTNNDNYRKYLPRMLRARALAYACRDQFGDMLAGISTPEELEQYPASKPRGTGQPVIIEGENATPQPTKTELVNLMREVTDAMNAYSMPSTERDAVKMEMAEAYQKGDGQHLADMALRLREKAQEMLDKSHAARKPMPDPTPAQEAQDAVIVPNPPEDRPEEALKASLVDAIVMLMNAGKYEIKHVVNSLRKNFPALVDSLSEEDTDWKAAIWSCTVENELIMKATEYYANAYKREIKKAAMQPAPAKEKPPYDSAAMLKIIDGILTREEWDLESDYHSDIAALLKDGSEEAHKAIMAMIGAKAGDITKIKALLDRHSLTLQDMGIFGDVQPEHLGKKEIGNIIYELENRK